jgi:hypothetical protein
MNNELKAEQVFIALEVGKKYLIIKPAHSFGIIDGEQVDFEEQRTEILVLPKPETVIACDGETEVEETLPEHLAKPDWYAVRKLSTNLTFWLNPNGCKAIEI